MSTNFGRWQQCHKYFWSFRFLWLLDRNLHSLGQIESQSSIRSFIWLNGPFCDPQIRWRKTNYYTHVFLNIHSNKLVAFSSIALAYFLSVQGILVAGMGGLGGAKTKNIRCFYWFIQGSYDWRILCAELAGVTNSKRLSKLLFAFFLFF